MDQPTNGLGAKAGPIQRENRSGWGDQQVAQGVRKIGQTIIFLEWIDSARKLDQTCLPKAHTSFKLVLISDNI